MAALNGLIYIFLVPPWQHNDEPGNFEFAWMYASMEGKREEWRALSIQAFRREVAASMVEAGFFEPLGYRPNLILLEDEIWIGLRQIAFPDFAFWLYSLPLRLIRHADVVLQLYVARLVSWLLFLFTVYLAILANRESGWEQKLGSLMPLVFVFFPSFVDKMTAINDDVAAVTFFTLFLYICLRIWKRGLNLVNLIALLSSALLCVVTKRNVWVSVPLGVLWLLLFLLRRFPKGELVAVGGFFVAFPFVLFSLDTQAPAYFYAFANHQLAAAMASDTAMAGERVAHLPAGYHLMYQPLSKEAREGLAGKNVRVGVWMWGKGEINAVPLVVWINQEKQPVERVNQLPEQPTLIQQTITLPQEMKKIAMEIGVVTPEEGEITLDCLFLIPDSGTSKDIPSPLDDSCKHFQLGTQRVENYVRNASFERTWWRLQPWLEQWVDQKFAFSITHLWAIFDPPVGYPYLQGAAGHVFQTFWGRFGWGSVPLVGANPYSFFGWLTLFILLGNVLSVYQRRNEIAWQLIAFLFLSFFLILVMTLFRHGGNWIWYEAMPNARYLMPAILPLAMFIVNGWATLLGSTRPFKDKPILMNVLWFLLLIGYNLWALWSIWSYYQSIRS
ncbi:MAG: hypothetical protein ANABAC_0527 [Anaerolineae bacterium]|nr:MAG: hypothetical protein ANABAC_0527 [Anaerolineae bacterium]